MSIKNTRKVIKKNNLDSKLKSKLKENFDWMTEDDTDTSLEDDDMSMDDLGGEDLDAGADTEMGDEDGLEPGFDLDPSQEQQLDSEVDELLSFGLEDDLGDDLLSEADDDMDMDMDSDMDSDMDMDVEASTDDMDFDGDTDGSEPVTDFIDTDELQAIINSPNSLGALETELVAGITSEDDDDFENDSDDDFNLDDEDLDLEENEDPFKGIKDLPGFSQGYKGEARMDDLLEDVDLAKELAALDFENVSDNTLDGDIKTTVSPSGIKGGADNSGSVMSESIKKSKMLVKAAAAILKLKQMQESASRQVNKLKFENSKLSKVNAILAVAGDKMTKDVRTKIVESFQKCKSQKDVSTLYSKVVNVIKESNKPSLNKTVSKVKTQVKTTSKINESSNRSNVKSDSNQEQQRKNHLMGMETKEDQYYNFN